MAQEKEKDTDACQIVLDAFNGLLDSQRKAFLVVQLMYCVYIRIAQVDNVEQPPDSSPVHRSP